MKNVLALMFVLALGSQAHAHGSVAHQAHDAVGAAIQLFSKNPVEITRNFSSVSAVLAGHEKFNVTITLRDQITQYQFVCVENESVNPVIWDCSPQM